MQRGARALKGSIRSANATGSTTDLRENCTRKCENNGRDMRPGAPLCGGSEGTPHWSPFCGATVPQKGDQWGAAPGGTDHAPHQRRTTHTKKRHCQGRAFILPFTMAFFCVIDGGWRRRADGRAENQKRRC